MNDPSKLQILAKSESCEEKLQKWYGQCKKFLNTAPLVSFLITAGIFAFSYYTQHNDDYFDDFVIPTPVEFLLFGMLIFLGFFCMYLSGKAGREYTRYHRLCQTEKLFLGDSFLIGDAGKGEFRLSCG